MKAVLARRAPAIPVVDLMADAPAFEPQLAAYLLAAYGTWFAPGDVLLAVVDPGVGSSRRALAIEADGRFLVGPDNGLFEPLLRRSSRLRAMELPVPEGSSATFHGRDVFAPAAARLAREGSLSGPDASPARFPDWPDDLDRIVYVDRYGNAMTGIRAQSLGPGARLVVSGQEIGRARTFSDVPKGAALWYQNANGLAEIAVNGGRAADRLGLEPGTSIDIR